MACAEHSWYFDTPCPTCGPAVPLFLQRNPDRTFKYPDDPEASAAVRKAEYAADEKEDQPPSATLPGDTKQE